MKKLILLIVLIMTIGIYSQTMMQLWKGGIKIDSIAITNDLKLTFTAPTSAFTCGTSTVDYSGMTYHTVQMGTQCWLKENLNVGTMIDSMSDQSNNGIIEKYCYNNNPTNCTIYGGFYQWAEAVQYQNGATNTTSPNPPFTGNVQGICPTGWHIPTNAEFTTLSTTVGGDGNALKAIGEGTGAGAGTNTSGFSGLLAGYRLDNKYFFSLGNYTYFWSSTEYSATITGYMILSYNVSNIYFSNANKDNGFIIRCVKD